jgi:hypothetical protein
MTFSCSPNIVRTERGDIIQRRRDLVRDMTEEKTEGKDMKRVSIAALP